MKNSPLHVKPFVFSASMRKLGSAGVGLWMVMVQPSLVYCIIVSSTLMVCVLSVAVQPVVVRFAASG